MSRMAAAIDLFLKCSPEATTFRKIEHLPAVPMASSLMRGGSYMNTVGESS